MIERYTRPRMGKLWSEEEKLRRWLGIELLVCEVMCERGLMPRDAVERLKASAAFDPERIAEIEAEIRHDVLAFVENVQESIGEDSRYFHRGLTSYDLVDTALSLAMVEAAGLLREGMEGLRDALRAKALEYRDVPQAGRTHGRHAAPLTFGLKLAVHADAADRCVGRLKGAREEIRVGKISGSVGTYAHLDPSIEDSVCRRLGLRPGLPSSQVLGRDRHASFMNALAVAASVIENLSVEVRNLQRTETAEAAEPFARGQKGSSSMPHKRNPVVCERMSGLARILRGHAAAAAENVVLWHERDISHSSAERIGIPDSCILLDYMASKMTAVVEGLEVDTSRMASNLELSEGRIHSESLLVGLMEHGASRREAYETVRSCAERSRKEGRHLRDVAAEDGSVTRLLSPEEVRRCFDLTRSLRNVGEIFERLEWSG